MTDNSSDIAIPVGTFAFHSPIQNYTISFHNGADFRNGDKVVGKLDFNGPQMKFSGNADESVDAFVRAFGHWFDGRLKKEREAERDACAKVCLNVEGMAGDYADKYAAAIRARGEA